VGAKDGPDLSAPIPLTAEHDLSRFDCGTPALNDWLQHRALRSENRFARTYVVCSDKKQVVGYYCISAASVERSEAPGKLRRNAPDNIPVALIGRLAVDLSRARRGLGTDLLADALRRIALASRSIGIAAVLVHAKDGSAREFYLKCAEFIEYPQDSRLLFLPVDTIVAALR
jgi:GNAT superfamily N-acetyltransferase